MFKLRDIPPGHPLPVAAVVTRTGPLRFDVKQLMVRFPIWASYSTRYYICYDGFLTTWWVRIVQLSFERGANRASPIIAIRLTWGDAPILKREKPFEPKPLVD